MATESSPNAPRQASPARSFRSRMGTMLRRNSSGFNFRPQTPSQSDSRSSLKVDATLSPPAAPESHAAPSPVAESPAREAAAQAADIPQPVIGPSPLSREAIPTPELPAAPLPPVTLTQEPESISASVEAPKELSKREVPENAPSMPEPSRAAEPEQTLTNHEPVVEQQTASPEQVQSELPSPPPATEPVVSIQPITVERGADTFSWGNDTGVVLQPSHAAIEAIAASPDTVPDPLPEPIAAPEPVASQEVTPAIPAPAQDSRHYEEVSQADTFAWRDPVPASASRSVSPKQSSASLGKVSNQGGIMASPEMLSSNISRNVSRRGSKSSMASSFGQVVIEAGGKRVAVSMPDADSYTEPKRGRSRASSIRVSFNKNFEDPYTDPFADPPEASAAAHKALSPIDSVVEPQSAVTAKMPSPTEYPSNEATPMPATSMPLPRPEQPEAMYVLQTPPKPTQEPQHQTYSPSPIVMSLPPAESVINSRVQKMPSAYSLGEQHPTGLIDHHPLETDERLPLLNRGYGENIGSSSKAPAQADTSKGVAIAFPSVHNGWPTAAHSLQILGWSEILLPDSSIYYVNRGMRITTDIDLRSSRKLQTVTEYLDRKLPQEVALPPQGWELWLRETSGNKDAQIPARSWVNHAARSVSFIPPPVVNGEAETAADHVTDDDRLDMEYRYWSFMESHPAHIPLPVNAHVEALDALKWTYTDTLLPTEQPIPPPFSPQECQELMNLLRSFDSDANDSVVHTRVVSRVLIRLVQWRQQYFRPNKPLPTDTVKTYHPRQTFSRFLLDLFMSLMCLGIPYLFAGRSQYHRIDEESGVRNPGPMVMIGACACLVSAVILSASVTFMTLPGLDDVARLAGLIAILFSASSMVSSVVALFRWKADVERTVVYVGGEGLTLLTKRSIVMSLPLVFLAWAIAAFITGITFYSFRGATITSRIVIRQPFEDYTHWAVVGMLGGLAGILLMSIILARR